MSLTSITTIRNGGNMSRYEMLEWMNSKAQEHIDRIEDLCTGVAYCRMMDTILPNSINMKRVKMTPRRRHEYKHNMRLLQDAFNRLELEQPVPIDLIVQGRFKHNFEFIQFFKKFYDSQTSQPALRLVPKSRKVNKRVLAKILDKEQVNRVKEQADLVEKVRRARDFAYHKLILIEHMLSEAGDEERSKGIGGLILKVLRARMEDQVPEGKGDAQDDPSQ
ncbi:hypothetical protein KR054_008426 [Drosophila jambulina]|nr:hypothetical protein KR054_008426 [Drosophila jambulina]